MQLKINQKRLIGVFTTVITKKSFLDKEKYAMLILGIDTSTHICSVALAVNGATIDCIENTAGHAHASLITVQIEEILHRNQYNIHQLHAVAVSQGPGSYTGLRIGVSAAKGICYALNIPLIAVSTLEALTRKAITNNNNEPGFYMPMLDAMRMEVYTAVYTSTLECIEIPQALVITPGVFDTYLNEQPCYYFGTGAAKCRPLLQHPNAGFMADVECSATNLSEPAFERLTTGKTEDIAYFFPDYIKNFFSNKSKTELVH